MQRTVRTLRVVLPIAFVGFVLVIIASWQRNRTTSDRASSEPVVVSRPGEKPQLESKVFEDTQTVGGRVVSHIRAKRLVGYTSNWATLENVDLTIYRANGSTYDLTCPQAQFNSQTKEAEAQGGVKVTSSDGTWLSTASLRFDGNRLSNHIPVQFQIDNWRGNAGAMEMDVAAETVRLYQNLSAATVPTPAEPPMTLKAADGLFRRKENDVAFHTNVVFTRLADRVDGDQMTGKFGADKKTLSSLDGNGHIVMVMSGNPAPGEDLGGRKTITCDRFFSEVSPVGAITALDAVGDTAPAHAVLDGPPKRDLVAHSFRVALENRQVTEIKAEPQVVMKEFVEVVREIDADHITVAMDPRLHKPSTAFLEGNVRYTDPRNRANSIRANYDIAGDRVLLTAQPGFDPTVVSDGNILKAHQIEFSPRAGTAKATGSVIAQLVSKGPAAAGASADSTNVFPAGKPVFVNSDQVTMRQVGKIGVFSGNVHAWQDNNTVFSQEMQVQGAGDVITAKGGVRTTLYNTDTTGPPRTTPVVSHSDQLIARKADRRIDLTGSVRIDDETRTMTGDHASFFFALNRKLDHIEAENKVVLNDSATGRKATGDRAAYRVSDRTVLMFGKPATATAPNGMLSGDEIQIDLARNKVEVLSPGSPTKGSYKPPP